MSHCRFFSISGWLSALSVGIALRAPTRTGLPIVLASGDDVVDVNREFAGTTQALEYAVEGIEEPSATASSVPSAAAADPCYEPVFCQQPDQGEHDGHAFAHSDDAVGSRATDSFTLGETTYVERFL